MTSTRGAPASAVQATAVPRRLGRSEVGSTPLFEFLWIDSGVRNDESDRYFSTQRVGFAHNSGFGDFRLFHQEFFNLARIDVKAAGDDQIALASAQRDVAVGRA